MQPTPFVLLLQEPGSNAEPIRQALGESARVQPVTRLSSAVARIAGGGVDGVVLDLSCSGRGEDEKLADFLKLKSEAPGLPLVVVCNSEEHALMRLAAHLGASACLTTEQCRGGLGAVLRPLPETRSLEASRRAPGERRRRAAVIGVLGSKGGTGVTTIALNVACALAEDRQVILTELHAAPGTVAEHFKLRERVRDLISSIQPGSSGPWEAQAEACLWRYQRIPGLRVLFGPQTPYPEHPFDVDHATAILRTLEPMAEFVIADLGHTLTEANRGFIEACACLAIVIERDLVSLEAARKMLRAISAWEAAPQSIGAVVVSRTAVATPVPIDEFESRLEIPIYSVVPPAGDDCLAAQRAGKPLVVFDNETLAAQSLMALSELLRQSAGPVQLGHKLVTT